MTPRVIPSRSSSIPIVILLAWTAAASAAQPARQASGVGATFPEPAYAQWARLFTAETGERIAYSGVGSGKGVAAIEASAATFGASDVPLDDEALQAKSLIEFPTLIGGVLPVLNVPGIRPGDLAIDGPTLAAMFMGRIVAWDDPAVRRLNPHLPLPHLAIVPVRRADASGTSAVFTSYLSRVSADWDPWTRLTPDAVKSIGVAAEGNEGMADAVTATAGAVGYVGFDYALTRHLAYADLVNRDGKVVQPTLASIAAAAAAADWDHGLAPSLVDAAGPASWPIVSATYVLMRRTSPDVDAPAAATALRFFAWSARSGGPAAEDLGFVPLPAAVADLVRRSWIAVTDASGRALAPPR